TWRDQSLSPDSWKETGKAGEAEGEGAGYYVTCGPVNAFAKPSTLDPAVCRAAHEKIASDLAFDLGLPVPPAVLLRCPKPPVGNQPNVVLSLIPFLAVHKWRVVRA